MAVIKCKMCGGDLVIEPGATVAECEYCGTRQTIPNQDDEKKLTLFARANRHLKASFERHSLYFPLLHCCMHGSQRFRSS